MSSVLVGLFWIWCGISLVILIARPVHRRMKVSAAPIPPMIGPDSLAESLPADATSPIDPMPFVEVTTPSAPLNPTESPIPMEPPTPTESPSPAAAVPTRSRSVAAALPGFQMPCDLAPLMGIGAAIDPTHVVFATERHPYDEVGGRIGEELERIGCNLMRLDPTTLRAERGADSVEVRLYADGATVMEGTTRRFPTAPSGSVVVDFRLR